jgi:hypothetical protein
MHHQPNNLACAKQSGRKQIKDEPASGEALQFFTTVSGPLLATASPAPVPASAPVPIFAFTAAHWAADGVADASKSSITIGGRPRVSTVSECCREQQPQTPQQPHTAATPRRSAARRGAVARAAGVLMCVRVQAAHGLAIRRWKTRVPLNGRPYT